MVKGEIRTRCSLSCSRGRESNLEKNLEKNWVRNIDVTWTDNLVGRVLRIVQYRVWKKVFARLSTVSWFGAKTFIHTLYSTVQNQHSARRNLAKFRMGVPAPRFTDKSISFSLSIFRPHSSTGPLTAGILSPKIHIHYLLEDKSLSDPITYMKEERNFHATWTSNNLSLDCCRWLMAS